MRFLKWFGITVMCMVSVSVVEAQPAGRNRPIRVRNINLLTLAGGVDSHDNPTFGKNSFFTAAYQRRVLRRELRWFPIWVRGAIGFRSEERDLNQAFPVFAAGQRDDFGTLRDLVEERTSDFTVRGELLADVFHSRNAALYAGGGIVIHTVSFRSREVILGGGGAGGFEESLSRLGPSLVAGGRLFMASQPWTVYTEARYGRVHGRIEAPWELGGNTPLKAQTFDLQAVNTISIEGGVGVHW